jgi:hypothetical protein
LNKRRLPPVGALLLAVALLSGCAGGSGTEDVVGPGSGPAAGGRGTPPNPCTLVTKDEASAALGVPAADGELFPGSDPECRFRPVGPEFQYLQIEVSKGGRAGYDFSFKIKKDTFPEFAEVAGLGDAAFSIGKEVTVLKGAHVAVFFLGGVDDDPDVRARVLALAKAGTARLG